MVLAVHATQTSNRAALVRWLMWAISSGLAFSGIRSVGFAQIQAASDSRRSVPIRRRNCAAFAELLYPLFCYDWPARLSPDYRFSTVLRGGASE